ncbi:uncharacterized protein LOC143013057 isoform X1 [Genypterus blacodes]|uniref:uncharacterized protein LOC143013057 isoform X1 n=1 Tax=Genypterus blacodes TaxID=154954 RepID=UPI003F772994
MMSDVSEESLLDYFYSAGGNSGKVKNADILKTFKPFIGHSDLQLRAKYREEFRLVIDRIAVVKSENGEKHLVLKKKYRQLLQERHAEHYGMDGDKQRHTSPVRVPATVKWEVTDTSAPPLSQKELQDRPALTATDTREQSQEGLQAEAAVVQLTLQGPSAQSNGEDELDKDSGSKSESEQDEEGTGSMGSTSVALDPIEKEWIYSAACARVPYLSQLLSQEPWLANKKDFTSGVSLQTTTLVPRFNLSSLILIPLKSKFMLIYQPSLPVFLLPRFMIYQPLFLVFRQLALISLVRLSQAHSVEVFPLIVF